MSVKSNIRKELIERRKHISDKILKDSIICQKLVNSKEYKEASLVLLYAALDDEINIDSLIVDSLKNGKKVALPRCLDDKGNMSFYYIQSLFDLEKSHFSVREPKSYCKMVDDFSSSICIVPGLSFDKNNYRIGYGKGYYDRFLKNYVYISIGLCYNELISDNLPIDNFDLPVSFVITD